MNTSHLPSFLTQLDAVARNAANECALFADTVRQRNTRLTNLDYASENEAVFNAMVYSELIKRSGAGNLTLEPSKNAYESVDLVYCETGLLYDGIGNDKSADYLIQVEEVSTLKQDGTIGSRERNEICSALSKLLGWKTQHRRMVVGILLAPFTAYNRSNLTQSGRMTVVREGLVRCDKQFQQVKPQIVDGLGGIDLEDNNSVFVFAC